MTGTASDIGAACPINRGMVAKLLSGRCPKCNVGLTGPLGHIYNSGKVRLSLELLIPYSCPHCGYAFAQIEVDMWGGKK